MIISASRRTDIPSYYSEWFFNRIHEGYVLVRNPINPHQISRIELNPDVVDGIVFWTKNPLPMMERIDQLTDYPYYFQFTLTGYGRDIEPNLPLKKEILIPAFRRLSEKIGRDRVIWRYDPVLFTPSYTFEYHSRAFRRIAELLRGCTDTCIVSYLDFYRNTRKRLSPAGLLDEGAEQFRELMASFSEAAASCGMSLATCAETADLSDIGVGHARCIDPNRLSMVGSRPLKARKDKNQRLECGCAESIDIGAYDTCKNGCLYCYANHSDRTLAGNLARHNPNAPLLFGEAGPGDIIKNRRMESFKI